MSWPRSFLGTTSIVRTQPLMVELRMKCTVACDPPIVGRGSSRVSAGHVARRVPGHRPWLLASQVIGSRFVSNSTEAGGIFRSYRSSVQLRKAVRAHSCTATEIVQTKTVCHENSTIKLPKNSIMKLHSIALLGSILTARCHSLPLLVEKRGFQDSVGQRTCPSAASAGRQMPRTRKIGGPGHLLLYTVQEMAPLMIARRTN